MGSIQAATETQTRSSSGTPLKMGAVALGLEQAAAFQYDHAQHDEKNGKVPPINFFCEDCPFFGHVNVICLQ
ncbi:MAG: hypothetical protein ABMA02_01330 [Saprospiraceae bacterium]